MRGKRTKTGDNETNETKKEGKVKERQNEYEKHRVRSFQQPWGNAFLWVPHIGMTDTNGADQKMYCEVCQFYFGPLDLGSGPPGFWSQCSEGTPKYERICRTLNVTWKCTVYAIVQDSPCLENIFTITSVAENILLCWTAESINAV